jgi:H+/Cl- antiporter ClcA
VPLQVDIDHRSSHYAYYSLGAYYVNKRKIPSSASAISFGRSWRLSSSLSRRRSNSSNCAHVNPVREEEEDDNAPASFERILRLAAYSIAAATTTAAMGLVYSQMLAVTRHLLWKTLPAVLLIHDFGVVNEFINPFYFISAMLTTGGFLVGVLSSMMTSRNDIVIRATDFVSATQAADEMLHPSSILPLLLLSLVTSAFGFSLSPEVAMIYAGGLVGATLSRRWFGTTGTKATPIKATAAADPIATTRFLARAGAAGALASFVGLPIAASILALEIMIRPSSSSSAAALSRGGGGGGASRGKALSETASVVVGLVLLRAFFINMAGSNSYGDISGRAIMGTALLSSVMGAGLGAAFRKTVSFLQPLVWPIGSNNSTDESSITKKAESSWKRIVAVKTAIGLFVGILSIYYPQTLFSGQEGLQTAIDGQRTSMMAISNKYCGSTDHFNCRGPRQSITAVYRHGSAASGHGQTRLLGVGLCWQLSGWHYLSPPFRRGSVCSCLCQPAAGCARSQQHECHVAGARVLYNGSHTCLGHEKAIGHGLDYDLPLRFCLYFFCLDIAERPGASLSRGVVWFRLHFAAAHFQQFLILFKKGIVCAAWDSMLTSAAPWKD